MAMSHQEAGRLGGLKQKGGGRKRISRYGRGHRLINKLNKKINAVNKTITYKDYSDSPKYKTLHKLEKRKQRVKYFIKGGGK